MHLSLQVTHQYVPVDADLVLSQAELQLGVKLIQHLTSLLKQFPGQENAVKPDANTPVPA